MTKETLRKLVAISTVVSEAQDRDDLFQAIYNGCISLGFDQFILSCDPQTKHAVVITATLTTFPDTYRRDYNRLGWSDGDMHTARALGADTPFFWNSGEERYAKARPQGYINSLIDFLKTSQMKNGVVVPIRRNAATSGFCTLASLKGVPETPETAHTAKLFADFVMAKAEKFGLCSPVSSGSSDEATALRSLSDVQQEVLMWIAKGKSNPDIATILELPKRTVRYHVSVILRKLGAVSRTQAATIGTSGYLLAG